MTTSTGQRTILIIEDEAYIRDSLEEYFRDEGFKVVAVERGEDALNSLTWRRFDLCIVDIRLSGIDGTRTIAQLKSADPNTQILVFTGSLEFQINHDLAKLGLTEDSVVFKPITDLDLLGQKVKQLLGMPVKGLG